MGFRRRTAMRRKRYKPKEIMASTATGPLDGGRSEAMRSLRQDNEDDIFSVLSLLWRRSGIIAGFCLVVVIIAALVTSLVQKRYTADAFIQARLASDNRQAQSGIVLSPASMIETEARLISSSRTIAQRVVARLDLINDKTFVLRKPLAARAHDLLASVWPSFEKLPSRSAESLIADELMRNLTVTNDIRSYLIKISYTSTSPELSARIANAIAEEYLRERRESSARQELADLVATYGPKHPKILEARAELDKASRSNMSEDAQLLIPAEPIALPSSPSWLKILGLAFVGSLVVGIVVVLIREHAAPVPSSRVADPRFRFSAWARS
jgi:uncharacterized protein involved in exopolysaccharide biosynthesis